MITDIVPLWYYLDVPKMTGINTQNDERKRFNRADYRATGGHYLGDRSDNYSLLIAHCSLFTVHC
jgi:hypothetical protein